MDGLGEDILTILFIIGNHPIITDVVLRRSLLRRLLVSKERFLIIRDAVQDMDILIVQKELSTVQDGAGAEMDGLGEDILLIRFGIGVQLIITDVVLRRLLLRRVLVSKERCLIIQDAVQDMDILIALLELSTVQDGDGAEMDGLGKDILSIQFIIGNHLTITDVLLKKLPLKDVSKLLSPTT
jgi:hypothetical protein